MTNPYVPPTSNTAGGGAPVARAGNPKARRISFILAAVGLVVFWGAAALVASIDGEQLKRHLILANLGVFLAVAAHLVGIGAALAAPRGRRMVPALVNAFLLGYIVASVGMALSMAR